MARKMARPTPEDAEAQMDAEGVGGIAAKRIGLIATSAPMASGTLAGDLRDAILDLFKTRPRTWDQMKEEEQQDIGRSIEYAARELVKGVVDVIRSEGQDSPVRAILEGYTDKGDIKATLKVKTVDENDAGDAIVALHKARGKLVLLTIASSEDYMGERGSVQTQADQGGLPFESGGDDEDGEEGDPGSQPAVNDPPLEVE